MSEIKTLECAKHPEAVKPSGVSTGSQLKHERPNKGDEAELICDGVSVLVKVCEIDGDTLLGVVVSFENYENEYLQSVKRGDTVRFSISEVHGWCC